MYYSPELFEAIQRNDRQSEATVRRLFASEEFTSDQHLRSSAGSTRTRASKYLSVHSYLIEFRRIENSTSSNAMVERSTKCLESIPGILCRSVKEAGWD